MNKNPKEILRESYEKLLIAKINEKGGNIDDPAGIWLNLQYLATPFMRYGEEKLIMPLQIKKILAYILDPDCHIEYDVEKTEKDCTITASFYWGGSEQPAGRGFVKRYLTQIFPNDGMSLEERESIFESTVRGLAATRAITDAGIAMQFYADNLDTIDPEMSDYNKDRLPDSKGQKSGVPDIPSNNEKKAKSRQRSGKTDKEPATNEAEQITGGSPDRKNNSQSNGIPDKKEGLSSSFSSPTPESDSAGKEADMLPGADNQGGMDIPSAEEVQWAKGIIVNVGRFAGYSLGQLLDGDKLNNIIWLSGNASDDVAKAAGILVKSDKKFDSITR